MAKVSETRRRAMLIVYVGILMPLVFACSGRQEKKVAVFVQATKDPEVNQAIMERYVWPVVRSLAKSGEPFELDIYAITGNTASVSAFYSATVRQGPTEGQERKTAEKRFLQLRTVLDSTYGAEESELVDVLGSIQIVDDILGRMPEGRPLHVIYVSDMIQSNGVDGYDFTGNLNGKSLEECRSALNDDIGSKLLNRSMFTAVQVLVLRLNLQSLFREKGTEAAPPPSNLVEIDHFWANDLFARLLAARSYHIDTSKDPRRAIQEFLQ